MQRPSPLALRLVAFAAASLYFELAIIRLTAAEVLYLGYFSNFILISAFVGLGLGFLAARRKLGLGNQLPFLLLFIYALVLVSQFDATILKNRFGLFFFGNIEGRAGLPGGVLLLILFVATVGVFACFGELIGSCFEHFTPLRAYTLDIVGSLLGIGLFSFQCAFDSGPVIWSATGCLLVALGWLVVRDPGGVRRASGIALAGLCMVVLLLSSATGTTTLWSRYQKLELERVVPRSAGLEPHWRIRANGIDHQGLLPVEMANRQFYARPYIWRAEQGKRPGRVLVIGAGSGTDVAVALARGATEVTAVEIDPGIVDLGREHHPDAPYDDPRVRVVVADGREFLRHDTSTYDVIVFALPDSIIRLSSMSNVRLESYLFTLEAFRSVKTRLAPDGLFVMYNQYRWTWLVDKLAAMLEAEFGRPPRQIKRGEHTTVLAVGPTFGGPLRPRDTFTGMATDDWPFVYLRQPTIHWLYLGMIALFVVVSLLGVLILAPAGTLRRPDVPFFMMGAAFLLLETKSISFFSLLFGATWMVNSMAFAGVLTSVLLANLIVGRWQIQRRWPLFAGLFGALALAYLTPAGWLLGVGAPWLRYGLSVALVFSPIFFANLVFSREFRDVDESTSAFGWNLLGAVVGGGLEYLSLLLGQRQLLLVVAACYLLVALLLRRRR